jgi:hypothetical protein
MVFRREASEKMMVNNYQHSSQNNSGDKLLKNRNNKGHFIKGNTVAVGAGGNPNPPNQFQMGNQVAKKHGMFANFLPEKQSMFELARFASLDDELALSRVRVQTNLELIEYLKQDIRQAESDENKRRLLDILWKMEEHIDVLVFRIESLTKTISRVGVDAAQRERINLIEQIAEFGETENR